MVVVCDISAWQYWRTPPQLRDEWADPAFMEAYLPASSPDRAALRPRRKDAREADAKVHARLLGDLKGVRLPVHVMVDEGSSLHHSELVIPHRMTRGLPASGVVGLGGGLHVLSPEMTLILRNQERGIIQTVKMMFEAAGIFSLAPPNDRMGVILQDLVERRVVSPEASLHDGIYGFSDERGRRLGFLDARGNPLSWTPTFDRHGRLTDLWKRPPLTSAHDIAAALDEVRGSKGVKEARRALALLMEGAASPEEVRAALMLCSGVRHGGESWGRPDLNRRIIYTPEARALAHASFAVADLLWPELKVDLEVQGKAFHADERGFEVASGRRAALESMGYQVRELTHEQMANLSLFDAIVSPMATQIGLPLQRRSRAFLERRRRLHGELFGKPYEQDAR